MPLPLSTPQLFFSDVRRTRLLCRQVLHTFEKSASTRVTAWGKQHTHFSTAAQISSTTFHATQFHGCAGPRHRTMNTPAPPRMMPHHPDKQRLWASLSDLLVIIVVYLAFSELNFPKRISIYCFANTIILIIFATSYVFWVDEISSFQFALLDTAWDILTVSFSLFSYLFN